MLLQPLECDKLQPGAGRGETSVFFKSILTLPERPWSKVEFSLQILWRIKQNHLNTEYKLQLSTIAVH